MRNIKNKALTKLAQAWKNNIITDLEAKEVFEFLSVLIMEDKDIESEEELAYTGLNRKEIVEFKKVICGQ